jgi:hypothetical protein
MKKVVRVVLLLFVAASVTYLIVDRCCPGPTGNGAGGGSRNNARTATNVEVPTSGEGSTSVRTAPVLVAYYFHGTSRCPTCLKIEQYARDAIDGAYQAEIGSGRVRWEAVNYDEPANEHFVKDYDLVASSLVVIVSDQSAAPSAWRKLDRIWDLVGDEQGFKNYVIDEVKNMLRGDS